MSGTRLVIVLPEAPLPFGNAAARWYHLLLRELRVRGYRLTVFAVCKDAAEAAAVARAFPHPGFDVRTYQRPLRGGLQAKWESWRRPHSYLFSQALRRDLQQECAAGVDVLHLEQLWTGWLGLPWRERALVNVHYLFEIDLAAQKPDSWKQLVVKHRSNEAARRLARRFPHLCTLSARLAQHLETISPESEVSTVPLGLDLSLYPFQTAPVNPAPVLGLIGSFDWQPTYSAGRRLFERLWPEIKRRVPDAVLQVTGRGARDAFAEYAGMPDVRIAQDVPEILPYFRELDVLLYAPARCSGMKVKIMEAFALGVPVVTNAEGVEGLEAVDGIHADIREGDEALADAAVRLLGDRAARERRRLAARELMARRYAPATVVDTLERVYESVVRTNTPLRQVAAS